MFNFLKKSFDPIFTFLKNFIFTTSEKQIKLEQQSLRALIGDSEEVAVYGFKLCRYYEVSDALKRKDIKVDLWSSYRFPVIKIDKISFSFYGGAGWSTSAINSARDYKAILTSLVIENYKRSRAGEPQIPLLFCIGLEEDGKTVTLDSKKVAHDNSALYGSSMTDKELRRCYKIYSEGPDEIKSIAVQTFKFVNLKQSTSDKDLYTLEQLSPFWEQQVWKEAWQDRKLYKASFKQPKQFAWRKILNETVTHFDSINHFFRDDKYLEENGEVIVHTEFGTPTTSHSIS